MDFGEALEDLISKGIEVNKLISSDTANEALHYGTKSDSNTNNTADSRTQWSVSSTNTMEAQQERNHNHRRKLRKRRHSEVNDFNQDDTNKFRAEKRARTVSNDHVCHQYDARSVAMC